MGKSDCHRPCLSGMNTMLRMQVLISVSSRMHKFMPQWASAPAPILVACSWFASLSFPPADMAIGYRAWHGQLRRCSMGISDCRRPCLSGMNTMLSLQVLISVSSLYHLECTIACPTGPLRLPPFWWQAYGLPASRLHLQALP